MVSFFLIMVYFIELNGFISIGSIGFALMFITQRDIPATVLGLMTSRLLQLLSKRFGLGKPPDPLKGLCYHMLTYLSSKFSRKIKYSPESRINGGWRSHRTLMHQERTDSAFRG
jgi:hypothetical protein